MRGRDPLLTFLGVFMLVVGVGGTILVLHPYGRRALGWDLTQSEQIERVLELVLGVLAGVVLLHMSKPSR